MSTPGHNLPPAYDPAALAEVRERVEAFREGAAEWIAMSEISDPDTAAAHADFVGATRQLFEEAEAVRKAEKQPHLDAGRAVDDAFRPMADWLKSVKAKAAEVQKAWQTKERERRRAEKRELERQAREEAKAAQARADAGDASASVELAAAEKRADAAADAAENVRVQSRGAGRAVTLRKRTTARLVKPMQGFMAFKDHPDVTALLEKLAAAEFRAGRAPAGFERIEEEYAA